MSGAAAGERPSSDEAADEMYMRAWQRHFRVVAQVARRDALLEAEWLRGEPGRRVKEETRGGTERPPQQSVDDALAENARQCRWELQRLEALDPAPRLARLARRLGLADRERAALAFLVLNEVGGTPHPEKASDEQGVIPRLAAAVGMSGREV